MDKNQFNNHYQNDDSGRPLYAQPTTDQDYEETSDGYGNQSIEDDIQNIIFQAQQAFANKQITQEEFQMIKGTQQKQHYEVDNFDSKNTAQTDIKSPVDNMLMPDNTYSSKLGNKNQNQNKSQIQNNLNKLQQIDVERSLNQRQKSERNFMSSPSGDSKRYIDTNLDNNEEVYENNDNMHWTNQLSQIEEEQPRDYQLKSLEYAGNTYNDFQQNRIDQTASMGALPPILQNTNGSHQLNDKGHMTGHFNSKTDKVAVPEPNMFQNNIYDANLSPNQGSEYYVMSSQPVTGRRSRENLDSNCPFSSQSQTISQMAGNIKYGNRQRSMNKSLKSGEKLVSVKQRSRSRDSVSSGGKNINDGGGILNNRANSRGRSGERDSITQYRQRSRSNDRQRQHPQSYPQSIPHSIHSERSSEYQHNGGISNHQSNGMMPAQNVYSQLSFIFDQTINGAPQKKNDKELLNLMKDQATSSTNMLKHQIENTQRETEYYKKQMDIFKDQMHKANLREQKIETELTFFKNQVQKYEDQINKIQKQNTELERQAFQLKMTKMNDDTNNISFRGNQTQENVSNNIQSYKSPENSREIHSSSITKSRQINAGIGSVSPHNRIDLSMAIGGDNSKLVTQLQGDLKEIRTKFKMKEEILGFEKDANHQLNSKIDRMSEEFRQELVQKKKEIEQLKLDNNERIETIRLMNQQLENFTQFTSVEFPLMTGPAWTGRGDQSPISAGLNQSNQNKNGQKLVSMTSGKSLIENEMENILNQTPFAQNSDDEKDFKQQQKLIKNYHMPVGIRNKMNKSPMNGKNKKTQKQLQYPAISLFSLAELVNIQINSTYVLDTVALELKACKQKELNIINKEFENIKVVQHNIENLNKEKDDFSALQKTLTKENQDLKQKFSDLLDQFQEYVNESEQRIEEDKAQQQVNQEKMVSELNNSIKELEEMSQQLQIDITNKDEQIDRIELEKGQLQKDVDFFKDQQRNQDEQAEELVKSQITSLNEEISYLKKHYMVEMDLLREENQILQNKQLLEKSQRKSPYLKGSQNINESLEPQIQNHWKNPCQANGQSSRRDKRDCSADLHLSRQKSQNVYGGDNDYNLPFGRSTFNNDSLFGIRQDRQQVDQQQDFHPDDLDSQQRGETRNIRSSSYDRVINKTRNSRLSRSRDRNEREGSRSRSNQRQVGSRSKDLITGVQSTFDGLKRELVDKDRLIQSKNREIVKLRLENDEIKSNFEQIESLKVNQHQRNKTCIDLGKVIDNLRQELERTKINLFKGENPTLNNIQPNLDKIRTDEVINCESKMLDNIQDNIKDLKNLISLATEIFLLSSKYKYGLGTNGNHSPNKLIGSGGILSNQAEIQRLKKDNEQLQRTVYKYEGALAHIESANKNPSHETVQELKRLTQSQLTEIMNLQSQLLNMERQLIENDNGNSQNAIKENRALKTEIALLRENQARSEQLRDGNGELLNERRGLILRIEQLEQENQEHQNTIKERDTQHEELRSRITVIAELFEKKPIAQRYSFEVLCDFIHDKAKRLFNKYENAIKDKKVNQDGRGYSDARKIQLLEQDLSAQQELVLCIKSFIVPRMYMLLNKGQHIQQHEIEKHLLAPYLRQLMCEIETIYQKQQHENQNNYGALNTQSITTNANQNQNCYSNLVQLRNPPSNNNTIYTVNGHNDQVLRQQNLNGISANASEFEQVKEEKEMLNQKLDDFTKILGEFQKNQQSYEQENQQLKQKIGYLESKSEGTSLMATVGTVQGRNNLANNISGIYSMSSGANQAKAHFQQQSMAFSGPQLENDTTAIQSISEQNNFYGVQKTNC